MDSQSLIPASFELLLHHSSLVPSDEQLDLAHLDITAFLDRLLLRPDALDILSSSDIEVRLGALLRERLLTVSSAESCTGGKIACLLNRHAGSSAFYYGSVVAYDNSVKRSLLSVSTDDLDRFGAVSEPVVRQMALGVAAAVGTHCSVSTSGVAGPDGGTPDKPVGTVWMAIHTPSITTSHCFHIQGTRDDVTTTAALVSLTWLYLTLLAD